MDKKNDMQTSKNILLLVEDMPVDIAEGAEDSANVDITAAVSNLDISEKSTSPQVIDKYLSGEIPFDNYELLLEDEYNSKVDENEHDNTDSGPKRSRVNKKIPPHIKALIGESNLRYARGDHDTAKKLCYEIIRQHCTASEPYITLAQIFETTDPTKCLDYYMVASLCSPRNVDLWTRCAQLSVEANKVNQAIFCYTNAIRAQPDNIQLHLRRIQLLRQEKDNKNMLRSYVKMMEYLRPEHYDFLNQLAMRVACEYHQLKEYKKATDALMIPFQKCPGLVTPEMVNIMLELLLTNQLYSICLDIFLEHCNIEIEILLNEQDKIQIVSYVMPKEIQIDLRIKFIICAVKLKSFHLLEELLAPLLLMEDEVETVGDLFLDVIEALMSAERYSDALTLLVPLIKSNNYSLAAVWLKYANCQSYCEMYEQAIESYRIVMRMAPLHVEVKYNLAEVLTKMGQKSEALAILHQDPDAQEIDVSLLVLKIKLLKELEDYDEYWNSMVLLISRHCQNLRHFEEIRAVTFLERPPEKLARIKKLRQFRGESLDDKPDFVTNNEPTVDAEYETFQEALELCIKKKKFAVMQRLVFMALTSTRFKNKYDDLGLLGFFSSLYNRDSYHAYPLIREIVIHQSNNNRAWNLFNVLLQRADDLRHTRFIMRFLSSYMEKTHLRLLEANYCLTVGNIKIGLGYYLSKLRSKPTPLTCILLGCVLLYIFAQKHSRNKDKITKLAFALFLKYSTMRSKDAYEEIYYNLGRLYQHFGVMHLAKYYYELVLDYDSPWTEKYPDLSLKREAAYNLHIMYKNSKNYVAARNVLMKYIKI